MPKVTAEPGMDNIPSAKGVSEPLCWNLSICELRVRAVCVPLKDPIKTASGDIPQASLVLFDLLTEEGITDSSYVF